MFQTTKQFFIWPIPVTAAAEFQDVPGKPAAVPLFAAEVRRAKPSHSLVVTPTVNDPQHDQFMTNLWVF